MVGREPYYGALYGDAVSIIGNLCRCRVPSFRRRRMEGSVEVRGDLVRVGEGLRFFLSQSISELNNLNKSRSYRKDSLVQSESCGVRCASVNRPSTWKI